MRRGREPGKALAVRSLAALVACVALSWTVGCGRSAETWTDEADRLLRDNDLVGSEKAYNRAIAADPHYAPALYGKGWALYLSGHESLVPAARQLFSRAVDYDPEYWAGYRGLGVLLMDEGKVAPAERMLRTAFEKDDREPTVLLSLGQLYLRGARYEEATKLFEAAIALAPARGEFLRCMAELELRRGDHAAALQWITEGRARPVGGRLGLMLLDEGELRVWIDRAATLLARATGPEDPALTEALQALDAADSLLEKAIQEDPRMRSPGQRRGYHKRLREQVRAAMGV